MRPIPATRLGDAHGLLRAIEKRGRLRTDEFVTEFNLDELFPPDLENALGRMRHFISFGRLAGLVKEDRGVVELTDVGKRYIRSGDADKPFDISSQQAEWLRRQLREKHMTDSIFHGLAIGLSLLASVPPGTRISTMDFGRSMAYLGRAGWDNENTLLIQGERHIILLTDLELIDADHRLTPAGEQLRLELTLPVHMGLADLAAQLNPGGADAVRAAAEEEFAAPAPEIEPPTVEEAPAPEPEPDEADDDNGYHTVIGSTPPSQPPPIVPRSGPPTEEQEHVPSTANDPLLPFAGAPRDAPSGGLVSGDPLASGPPAPSAAPPPQTWGPPTGPAPGGPPPADETPLRWGPLADPPSEPPPTRDAAPTEAPLLAPPEPERAPDESSDDADATDVSSGEAAAAEPSSTAPPVAPSTGPPSAPAQADEAPPSTDATDAAGEAPAADAPAAEAAASAPVESSSVAPPVAPGAGPDEASSVAPPVAPGAGPDEASSEAPPLTPGAGPDEAPPLRSGAGQDEASSVAPPVAPGAGQDEASSVAPPVAPGAGQDGAPPVAPDEASGAAPPAAPDEGSSAAPPVVPSAAPPSVPDQAASEAPPAAEPPRPPVPEPAVAFVEPSIGPPPVEVPSSVPPPPPPRYSPPPEPRGPLPPVAVSRGSGFVDVGTIRAASLSAGLRLPGTVYANVAAALAAGKHLILTGPPGSGKTTLAMAIARAAAQAGQAHGATVLTADHDWDPKETLVAAAQQGRWVIADEIDRSQPDEALGALSTFLAGIPVALPSTGEAEAAEGWRIVATAERTPTASAALTRRFATIEVSPPSTDEMHGALHQAANGDATATRAAERLLPLTDLKPLGAGVFLDAARHAAARNQAVPADDLTLAREAFAAYIAPLLGELDDEQQRRVHHLLGGP